MNNPYLLKSQLKENEEELSNYLRDMKIWHEQMKRKEQSPPVKVFKLKTKLLIFKFHLTVQFINNCICRILAKRKNPKLFLHQKLVQAKYHHGITLLGTNLTLYEY